MTGSLRGERYEVEGNPIIRASFIFLLLPPSSVPLEFTAKLDKLVEILSVAGMSHRIGPPASPSEVTSALSLALSPSPETRSSSLAALQAWSTLPGYYSYLVNIFNSATQVEDQVRLQALLQFKNGVDKYWRKTANK
jgi:hypothetical protein